MSLIDLFLVVYPYFCVLLINSTIIATALPHRICDTGSLRSQVIIISLILAGCAGVRSGVYTLPLSLFVLSVVIIHCTLHYLRAKQAKTLGLHVQPQELYKRIK